MQNTPGITLMAMGNTTLKTNFQTIAGSYGIQDYSSIFVEKITGSYDNVVGFPLSKFNNELKKINLTL